jgi:ABC-type dipeptide/oligopeptide/nickel transport system permease subunit
MRSSVKIAYAAVAFGTLIGLLIGLAGAGFRGIR